MGIGRVIGVLMVSAMDRHPARRRVLHATYGENDQDMLEPLRAFEAAVGEQPVVAEVDPEDAEEIIAKNEKNDARPTEEPRQKGEHGDQVINDNHNRIEPVDTARIHRRRKWQSPNWDGRIGHTGVHRFNGHVVE
jgi:hypothetical protein